MKERPQALVVVAIAEALEGAGPVVRSRALDAPAVRGERLSAVGLDDAQGFLLDQPNHSCAWALARPKFRRRSDEPSCSRRQAVAATPRVVPFHVPGPLDKLLKDRTRRPGRCRSAGGWYALPQTTTPLDEHKYEATQGYTTVILIATVSGFLLSLELRYIYRRLWGKSPRVIIGGALLSCWLFALVSRVIINSAYLRFTSDSMEWVMKSPLEFFSNTMSST